MIIVFSLHFASCSLEVEEFTTNQQNRHRNTRFITRSIFQKMSWGEFILKPSCELTKTFLTRSSASSAPWVE